MAEETLYEILELEKNGYRATAIRRLENYLRQHPQEAEAWYAFARIHTDPNQQKKAIELALSLRPDYPEAADFEAVLLAEYPHLAYRRARRVMLLLALLVTITTLLALFLWLSQEQAPEVVVLVPTEEPSPTETHLPTLAPTQFTLEPPLTSTLPPSPTSIPIPEEEEASSSTRFRVLIEPLEERLIEQLTENFPTLDFELLDSPVSDRNLLANRSAQLLIMADSRAGLTLLAKEAPQFAAQHPRLNPYLRGPEPWEISLSPSEVSLIRGAIAYATYDLPATIRYLAPTFDNPPAILNEDQKALLFMLAYSYQAQGEAKEALRLYDVLSGESGNLAVAVNRAIAIAQTGDPKSGITLLLSQLNQNPSFIHSRVGDLYWRWGNNPSAAQLAYEDAIRAKADSPQAYLARGQFWLAQNEYNRAREDFESALAQDPQNALAHYWLAQSKLQLSLYADALTEIESAIALQAQISDYQVLQGEILLAQGEGSQAAQILEEALALGNPSSALYIHLAEAYLETGNVDGAITASNQALDLDPSLPKALLARGRAYLAQNNPSRAVDDLSLGLTYDARSVPLLVARCLAYARLGDDGAAARDCDEALALDGVNGFALEQRGMIRHRAGDRAGAAADFQEAILYTPTAYEAHYFLGFYALQERRYPDAIRSLSRAIDLQSSLGKAYAARGVAYRITEQWAAAIADLEEAIILLPEDIYSYYELGLAKRFLADRTHEGGDASQASLLYQEAADAFLAFLNGSQATDEFVPQATQNLSYVRSALQALQNPR